MLSFTGRKFLRYRIIGYSDDWFAFDVFAKEVVQVETFNTVMSVNHKLLEITNRLDDAIVEQLLYEQLTAFLTTPNKE